MTLPVIHIKSHSLINILYEGRRLTASPLILTFKPIKFVSVHPKTTTCSLWSKIQEVEIGAYSIDGSFTIIFAAA